MVLTALDIEKVVAQIGGDQLRVMVADFILSLNSVDRSIPDCALGRLGLPAWFRKVCFAYHSQVRLELKLASGLGEPRCRDGPTRVSSECVCVCVFFIVALYVPWCRRLEVMPAVRPQLHANNLRCSAECPNALFGAARFIAQLLGL